jgi:hypothetical protein
MKKISVTLVMAGYVFLFVMAGRALGFLIPFFAGLVSLLSLYIANTFKIRESGNTSEIVFNPSELPWYAALGIVEVSGFTLFKFVDHREVSLLPMNYAAAFFLFYFVIPGLYFLSLLIINRNDRVVIKDGVLSWVDNGTKAEVALSSVDSVSVEKGFGGFFPVIMLRLKQGRAKWIPAYRMNFTHRGIGQLVQAIKNALR